MGANQKNLPPAAAAATRAVTTTVWAQVQEQDPCNLHKFRLPDPILLLRQPKNIPIQNHVSPPAIAQIPVASPHRPQRPPLPIHDTGLRQFSPAYHLAVIHTQDDYLDDASSFSITENGKKLTSFYCVITKYHFYTATKDPTVCIPP